MNKKRTGINPTMWMIVMLFSCLSVSAQNPDFQWAGSVGAKRFDEGLSITSDSSGNVYTTGYFSGIVDFDPGPATHTVTPAAGALGQDAFLLKQDASGALVWVRHFGGFPGSFGTSVTVDAFGNVYATGCFNDTVDFDPGTSVYNLISTENTAIYIAKYDTAGNFIWAKAFDGPGGMQASFSIATDPEGNIYTAGYFIDTTDFDPGPDTVYLRVAGGTGDSDAFISKLDSAGNFIWVKQMGGTSQDGAHSLALDRFGNLLLTGYFGETADLDPGQQTALFTSNGDVDVFVAKIDTAGNFIWAKQVGSTDNDRPASLAVDPWGNPHITGYFSARVDFDPGTGIDNRTPAGNWDGFLLKLDSAGNYHHVIQIGGPEYDQGNAVAVDALGCSYVLGYFQATATIDPANANVSLTSNGSGETFMTKFDTSGVHLWTKQIGGEGNDNGKKIDQQVCVLH